MEKNAETNLNEGQTSAVEGILQFILSDLREYNLSGPAGTGKTFMMRYIATSLMQSYYDLCKVMGFGEPKYFSIEYVATTNKAAEVLSNSVQRPARTVHSFLGLKVKDDFKTGKQEIIRTPNFRIQNNVLLFIDEASMIDQVTYSHLMEAMSGTNCKIIYVSDHSQLPPVSETLSQIYKEDTPISILSQPMRNADQPALMELCAQFRETVRTGKFYPIKIVDKVIDWMDEPTTKYAIDHLFKDDDVDCRILAYTNDRVNAYNQYIRALRNHGTQYVEGENLIFSSPFQLGSNIVPAETPITVARTLPDMKEVATPLGIMRVYDILVVGLDSAGTYLTVPENPLELKELLNHYKKLKAWPDYYGLKEAYPDLRPRDASTVHKAQGSTYDSVIIDLDNIGTCFDADQTARMLYVAVSRARNRIFLRGSLPNKYGGRPYYAKK